MKLLAAREWHLAWEDLCQTLRTVKGSCDFPGIVLKNGHTLCLQGGQNLGVPCQLAPH